MVVGGRWMVAALFAAAFGSEVDLEVARGRLQKELDRWREQTKAPGAVAAIVRDDGADGEGAAVASGLARREPAIAMHPTDRIFAGSIGKTFVAAVALQLVDEGKLDLDARIATWLAAPAATAAPDPAGDWFARLPNHDTITLRQLMNHTSGLGEYFSQPGALELLRKEPQKVWSPLDRLEFVLGQPPLFPAGKGWSYADTNYIVVGMVIEKVTGRAFYDECRERLLTPLELTLTEPADHPDLAGLVSGYTTPDRPFPFPEEVAHDGVYCANPQFEWTGGGFISNALDLARWARLLYGSDEVLPDDLRAQMKEAVAAKLTPGEKYGLGCSVRDTPLGPAVGHSGWFPGYLSDVAWYPDRQIAIAVQTNTDRGIGLPRLHAFLDAAAAAITKRSAPPR